MVVPGSPLWKILEAGEWRSPAFLKYLDMSQLDEELVLNSHMDESEVEGGEAPHC
jgi:hypothetical protein